MIFVFDGPNQVFVEEMLLSDSFGPADACGSIGWAQYIPGEGGEERFRRNRRRLARGLMRLMPLVSERRTGLCKLRWKLLQAPVPHGSVDHCLDSCSHAGGPERLEFADTRRIRVLPWWDTPIWILSAPRTVAQGIGVATHEKDIGQQSAA